MLASVRAIHLRMATLHKEAVARFGRLPSRNAIPQRASTAEEVDFLRTPEHLF